MIHMGIFTSHTRWCNDIWGCVGHWCWKKLYSLISQKWTQAHKQYWSPDTGAAGYCSSPHPFSSSYKSTVGTRRGSWHWQPQQVFSDWNSLMKELYCVLYTFKHFLFFPTELFKLQCKSYCCICIFFSSIQENIANIFLLFWAYPKHSDHKQSTVFIALHYV